MSKVTSTVRSSMLRCSSGVTVANAYPSSPTRVVISWMLPCMSFNTNTLPGSSFTSFISVSLSGTTSPCRRIDLTRYCGPSWMEKVTKNHRLSGDSDTSVESTLASRYPRFK